MEPRIRNGVVAAVMAATSWWIAPTWAMAQDEDPPPAVESVDDAPAGAGNVVEDRADDVDAAAAADIGAGLEELPPAESPTDEDPVLPEEADPGSPAVLPSPPAQANQYDELPDLPVFGPTSFSFTTTTIGWFWNDAFDDVSFDDQLFGFAERFEMSMQGTELRFQARLDAFLPIYIDDTCDQVPGLGPGQAANADDVERRNCLQDRESRFDIRPERITLHWQRGPWTVDLGDSRAVLGRGLALSLRLDDILGVDLAVRGAQLAYDGGELYAKLLGGLANPQNLDPVTLQIVPDPGDILAGGEVGYRFGDRQQVELGVQGTITEFGERGSPSALLRETGRVGIAGVHLSLPALLDYRANFYAEYNQLWRNDEFVNRDGEVTQRDLRRGRALYGQFQWQALNNLSVLVEWKDYRDFQNQVRVDELRRGEPVPQYQYSVLPALERDEERIRGTHNARGGRLQLDYGFFPGDWSLSGNFLGYGHAEDPEVDPWDDTLVLHGYVEVQKANNEIDPDRVGWALDLVAGYRRETLITGGTDSAGIPRSPGDLDWEVIHGIADGSIVFGDHSLQLRLQHRIESRLETVEYAEYIRGEAVLTYSWRGIIRFAPALRWNTEFADAPSAYPGFDVRWDFAPGSFLQAFGGRTPGGLVCSNGVCREVPPFEGARVDLVLRL